jgi:uncharacterized glyoxalase superfamily metalloenzyme YdcJ
MTQMMPSDDIRTLFSRAMSDMYRKEVPQYGTLLELVADVNRKVLTADPELRARLAAADELDRLDVERHGAIRLGTAEELSWMRRLFAVMGMRPVGYYDLSVAGIPVHSTAFRPTDSEALARNPFRVFCSLLRLDLLEDRALAAEATEILAARDILSDACKALIETAEAKGGLANAEARSFVSEALETFRWRAEARVSAKTYARLHAAHRLVADVVSFAGPHINHLTPRTLDIDAVQAAMPERGISPKAIVEGPPRREAGILLRQTSFKALEEEILFRPDTPGGAPVAGAHTARFGEIEQRGVALTPKGQAIYDRTLAQARAENPIDAAGNGRAGYLAALEAGFAALPDDLGALRREGLAYFRYRPAPGAKADTGDIEALIAAGKLIADPQVYEDFLPVSAAGIFQSNLGSDRAQAFGENANLAAFETALGAKVADKMALYAGAERDSFARALADLGVTAPQPETA